MPRLHFAFVPLAGLLAFAPGCQQPSGGALDVRHNPSGTGTPVATFHKDSITAEELERRFTEMTPFMRARYQTVEQRKDFVEEMGRFELLAAEAQARKLDQHPEVVAMAKQVMVRKLLEQELDEKPSPVSDAEIQAYYDAHKSDYQKPEMVRLSQVFLKAPKDSPERKTRRAEAEKVLAEAKKGVPMDLTHFAKLAREKDEDPRTKPLDGDLRYLSLEELSKQYGPELAEAAQKLTSVGEVSGVVESAEGFHVLKLQGRQHALDQSVQAARTQIITLILSERRAKAFHALVDGLKQKANFQVKEDALAKVKLDLAAPTQQPKGPPPQLLPAPPLPKASTASAQKPHP